MNINTHINATPNTEKVVIIDLVDVYIVQGNKYIPIYNAKYAKRY